MVQVTQRPEDEEEPMIPVNETQNIPDDVKSRAVANEAYKSVASAMMMETPMNEMHPQVCLTLLETALENRNVPLAKHYITILDKLDKRDHALRLLKSISKWIHTPEADHQLNFEPSAPPLVDNDDERNDNWMKEPLKRLRANIILEIDKDGDFFLKQLDIEDLHYQDILEIATRDTLKVSSEMVVYCAVMRWARAECHRKALPTEDVNIKGVLKELIYAPRYGLMSKKEFSIRTVEGHRGPDRIGLPTDLNEKILTYIKQKGKKNKNNDELPYKLSKQRGVNTRRSSSSSAEQPLKEKVIINFLTCFSAVFD